MRKRIGDWLAAREEWGPLFVRLAIGVRLVEGTQDNVFSYARMEEFAHFLAAHGTPFPLFSVFLSAYAQFVCGIRVMIGLFTRPAGFVLAVNFTCAIVRVGGSGGRSPPDSQRIRDLAIPRFKTA